MKKFLFIFFIGVLAMQTNVHAANPMPLTVIVDNNKLTVNYVDGNNTKQTVGVQGTKGETTWKTLPPNEGVRPNTLVKVDWNQKQNYNVVHEPIGTGLVIDCTGLQQSSACKCNGHPCIVDAFKKSNP